MLATRIVISVTVLVYFLSVYRRNFGSFFLFFPVNYIARALYLDAIPDERAWFLPHISSLKPVTTTPQQ